MYQMGWGEPGKTGSGVRFWDFKWENISSSVIICLRFWNFNGGNLISKCNYVFQEIFMQVGYLKW